MSLNYAWPIALVVVSNVVYHICSKTLSRDIDPMVSLFITYLTAGVLTAVIYFFTKSDRTMAQEFQHIGWPSIALGVVIVGLEFGYIMAYRAGWNISIGSLVANISLAVILLAVGTLLYKEVVSLKQAAGAALCIIGLILIQHK